MSNLVVFIIFVVNLVLVSSVEMDEETLRRIVREEIDRDNIESASNSKRSSGRSTRFVLDGEQRLDTSVSGTYVRWGRTDCPANGTELVYTGQAGGNHYTETGGNANFLCLPEDPKYDRYQAGHQQDSALVYGVEYEIDRDVSAGFFNKNLKNLNMPCAVCRTIRPSILMIPARNECYAGWTLEYKGYLAGGKTGHKAASEFICLDDDSTSIYGSQANLNGKRVYLAEVVCASSYHCPPYIDGYELTCAVCSQ